jgi:hypothetical protein
MSGADKKDAPSAWGLGAHLRRPFVASPDGPSPAGDDNDKGISAQRFLRRGWALFVGSGGVRGVCLARLTRLLFLNAILFFLWVTRDVAARDLPWLFGYEGGDDGRRFTGEYGDVHRLGGGGAFHMRGSSGMVEVLGSGPQGRNISGDKVISFNVIMTSNADRPTLQPMLDSILPQLTSDDFFTLISDADGKHPHTHLTVAESFSVAKCNCTKLLFQNSRPQGWWGHGSRTRWQKLLPGTYHMNADDDDLFLPKAMGIVRHWVRNLNATMFVFRMIRRWDERIELIPPLWVSNASAVRGGTVGTPCVVYRALRDKLPDWTGRYGGDGDFYAGLKKAMNRVVVVNEVIYHVGQREDLTPFIQNLTRGIPAEKEADVLGRRHWRKYNPDAPPQFLPAPQWAGRFTPEDRAATTGWEPAEAGPVEQWREWVAEQTVWEKLEEARQADEDRKEAEELARKRAKLAAEAAKRAKEAAQEKEKGAADGAGGKAK